MIADTLFEIRHWLFLLALCACSGSDASDKAIAATSERPLPVVLRIAHGTFVTNGVELRLGDDVARWRSALGAESRIVQGLSVFHVWDATGLWVATSKNGNAVIEVEITVNVEDLAGQIVQERAPQAPKRAYRGTLVLDDVSITPNTRFDEIRSGSDPRRNLRCGSQDCAHPHGGFGDDGDLLMRLAGKRARDRSWKCRSPRIR